MISRELAFVLGLSFFLSLFPLGRTILFPFQIFTTWAHECCHALTATILGGSSIKITIAANGSGLTHYNIVPNRIKKGIISSAGYLGTSALGCAIFYLTIHAGQPHSLFTPRTLAISLSAMMGISLLFWMRNALGFFSILLLGTALASLQYSDFNRYTQTILLFISIQTALNALFDLRTLFTLGSSKSNTSDAHAMQKLFILPHWFWSLSWLVLSLFMMYETVKITSSR